MNFETAEKINQACINHHFFQLGISDKEPENLSQYSLSDLLQAKQIIEHYNKIRTDRAKTIICDDRLIAALYTLYHYPANNEEAIIANTHAGLVAIRLPADFFKDR